MQTSPNSKHLPWGWLLTGVALIVLGVAAWLTLPKMAPQEETSAIPMAVNFPAPDLRFTTLEGDTITLSDYRGQVVLLNNWATWCPPCRDEMPTLEAYYQTHASQGFMLIAVAAHEYPFEIKNFLKKENLQLSFIIAPDPQETAMRAFHQTRLPASYVIDRDGTVRLMWIGAISRRYLEKYVTPLLEQ